MGIHFMQSNQENKKESSEYKPRKLRVYYLDLRLI